MHGKQCFGEIVREDSGEKWQSAFTTPHFVPWIVLGCNFMLLALNICIRFIRNAFVSCVKSEHCYRTPSGERI